MVDWIDLAFLAVGGFLLGSGLYLARETIRAEPWSMGGYLVIGAGVVIINVAQLWLQFQVNGSYWFMAATLAGYVVVAAGLTLLARARRAQR